MKNQQFWSSDWIIASTASCTCSNVVCKVVQLQILFHLPINDWNKSHYEGWKLEFDNSRIMLRICIINYIKKSVFFSISLSCQILHCIAWGVRFSEKWTNPRNDLYNKLLRSIILSSNISIWTKVSGLFIWVVCTGCLKNKINFSKRDHFWIIKLSWSEFRK